MKKTTDQLVKEIKIKKMSRFANALFCLIANPLYIKKCKVDVIKHCNPKDYKNKPVIIVANHSSRFDYAFVHYAMGNRRMNFVAAENEFHRKKFKTVFKLGKVIPKRNFYPDTKTINPSPLS